MWQTFLTCFFWLNAGNLKLVPVSFMTKRFLKIIALTYIYHLIKFGALISCGSKDIFENASCLIQFWFMYITNGNGFSKQLGFLHFKPVFHHIECFCWRLLCWKKCFLTIFFLFSLKKKQKKNILNSWKLFKFSKNFWFIHITNANASTNQLGSLQFNFTVST